MHTYTDNHFFIGIDVGHSTSSITYFDLKKQTADVINISGGFGRVTQETAMQVVEGESVFGAYAVTGNHPESPTQFDLLSQGDLQAFVEQIIGHVYDINPKAELVAITVVMPRDTSYHERLQQAFEPYAEQVAFATHDNCIIAYYDSLKTTQGEKFAVIDYGHAGLRFSLYEHDQAIKYLMYFEDTQLGLNTLEKELLSYVTHLYLTATGKDQKQLSEADKINLKICLHQNEQNFFATKSKDVNLYFNFGHPAVSAVALASDIQGIIEAYQTRMLRLIRHHLHINKIDYETIYTVLQTGGGFEMPWARELTEGLFVKSNAIRYTPTKVMPALGAAIISAARHDVIATPPTLQEPEIVGYDIGLLTNQGFHSILDTQLRIIPQKSTHEPFTLDIYKRDGDKTKLISVIDVDGIDRHHLSVELGVGALFANNNVSVTVTDLGFGDIAPPSGFERTYTLQERYLHDDTD